MVDPEWVRLSRRDLSSSYRPESIPLCYRLARLTNSIKFVPEFTGG